jgi:rare lipoprotein A
MANGQRFDRNLLTAACRWMPLGSRIRVFNLENGRFVDVTVTDRGPNSKLRSRILDLSEAAARELGYTGKGMTTVLFIPLPQTETIRLYGEAELETEVLNTGNIPTRPNPTERPNDGTGTK